MAVPSPVPIAAYADPRYPDRLAVLARPELLRRHVPAAWRQTATLAGASLLFLSVNACSKQAAAPAPKTTPAAVTAPQPPRSAALVAPLFEHGEGRGAWGGVMLGALPVFLSEDDALQVIREELGRAGVKLAQTKVARWDISVVTRSLEWDHAAQADQIVSSGTWVLELDGLDPERQIGVEFISREEYREVGGIVSMSTSQEYDFKEAGRYLAGQVAAKDRDLRLGIFYDPVSERADPLPPLDNEDPRAWEATQRAENEKALVKSRALLRLQVQDFINWLKAQGAI